VSEPRERSEAAKRRASERVGESEGRSLSDKDEGRCSIQLSYGRTPQAAEERGLNDQCHMLNANVSL